MGKSFLASKLNNLEVYETDCSETLPDIIKEPIIVIGNRFKYLIEDVESRILGKHITHIVDFKEY